MQDPGPLVNKIAADKGIFTFPNLCCILGRFPSRIKLPKYNSQEKSYRYQIQSYSNDNIYAMIENLREMILPPL